MCRYRLKDSKNRLSHAPVGIVEGISQVMFGNVPDTRRVYLYKKSEDLALTELQSRK